MAVLEGMLQGVGYSGHMEPVSCAGEALLDLSWPVAVGMEEARL